MPATCPGAFMGCTVKMVINGENRSIPKPDAFSNMNILDLKFSHTYPHHLPFFGGNTTKIKYGTPTMNVDHFPSAKPLTSTSISYITEEYPKNEKKNDVGHPNEHIVYLEANQKKHME